jgi:hypothetical protein
MIMGAGFNWAPPSVLVDTMGVGPAVAMIEQAGIPVPANLAEAASAGRTEKFFNHEQVNVGKYFVAS